MRILVVEDSLKMAELIRRVLVSEGHIVDVATDGASGLRLAAGPPYEAIVLDRMLPGIDGVEVLRQLREAGVQTPILMLTALGTVEHRVGGLDAGADDYLAKPFAFSELLARLRAFRRLSGRTGPQPLRAGGLELDEERHVARVAQRTSDLSVREFTLLRYFIRNADQVVSRRQILDAVWGAEPDVSPNVVDVNVHYLRLKLALLGRRDALRTVRGVGYSLRSEP